MLLVFDVVEALLDRRLDRLGFLKLRIESRDLYKKAGEQSDSGFPRRSNRTSSPFSISTLSHAAISPARPRNSLTRSSSSAFHRLTISSIVLPFNNDGTVAGFLSVPVLAAVPPSAGVEADAAVEVAVLAAVAAPSVFGWPNEDPKSPPAGAAGAAVAAVVAGVDAGVDASAVPVDGVDEAEFPPSGGAAPSGEGLRGAEVLEPNRPPPPKADGAAGAGAGAAVEVEADVEAGAPKRPPAVGFGSSFFCPNEPKAPPPPKMLAAPVAGAAGAALDSDVAAPLAGVCDAGAPGSLNAGAADAGAAALVAPAPPPKAPKAELAGGCAGVVVPAAAAGAETAPKPPKPPNAGGFAGVAAGVVVPAAAGAAEAAASEAVDAAGAAEPKLPNGLEAGVAEGVVAGAAG